MALDRSLALYDSYGEPLNASWSSWCSSSTQVVPSVSQKAVAQRANSSFQAVPESRGLGLGLGICSQPADDASDSHGSSASGSQQRPPRAIVQPRRRILIPPEEAGTTTEPACTRRATGKSKNQRKRPTVSQNSHPRAVPQAPESQTDSGKNQSEDEFDGK